MSASTKAGFPFDYFPNGIPFSFHGPNHWDWNAVLGNGLGWDDFPVTSVNVIVEFFVHGLDEIVSIGLP